MTRAEMTSEMNEEKERKQRLGKISIVKNKNTPENRAFWDHVERVAKHVRDNPEIYAHNRVYQVKGDR